MVSIESLACGTPVIGLGSGALGEVIENGKTGLIAKKVHLENGDLDTSRTIDGLVRSIETIGDISRELCREEYLRRFTNNRMSEDYAKAYRKLIESQDQS